MTQQERKGVLGASTEEEERKLLMEETTLLDIDMPCSTVVNLGKLNGDNEEDNSMHGHRRYERGVFRMWEGELVNDCFDDRRIALQSFCCPWYRFGKNMERAGFGSCFLQGSILLIVFVIAVSNLLAFIITRRHSFLYLAVSIAVSIGAYLGYHRMQIKQKFNIKDDDSFFDDCVYHLICSCFALSQESRTLEMNNVQDGIWHGRGDTICIGSMPVDGQPLVELNPSLVVSTKSSQCHSMQKPHMTAHIHYQPHNQYDVQQ